jgi:hypothetical protein
VRFRSAGLGTTELKGRIDYMAPIDKGLMVMHINTYSPVKWHLKAGMEPRDVTPVVKGIIKPSILLHIIRVMFYIKRNPKEITDIMDKSISL